MADPAPLTVSIAMATRNGAAHVRHQLASLERQTAPPAELVVCDDQSTDDTPQILRHFAANAPFPVRVVVNAEPLGVARNFAQAIGLCSGAIIMPADQDDIWQPKKIARMIKALYKNPQANLALCDAHVVNEHLERMGYTLWDSIPFPGAMRRRFCDDALGVLLRYNVAAGITMAFRAGLRPLALPIDEGWVHDGWIALLAAAMGPCVLVEEPLVLYRQHARQEIGGRRRSLLAQARHGLTMDEAYFRGQRDQYAAARQRLRDTSPAGGPREHAIKRIGEKVAHLERRIALRRRPRLWRWPGVAREALAGRYRRYGWGWKAAMQDLIA